MALPGGHHEGALLLLVHSVHLDPQVSTGSSPPLPLYLGPGLEQEQHNVLVAGSSSQGQGGPAQAVGTVDIGAVVEEEVDHLPVTEVGEDAQEGAALQDGGHVVRVSSRQKEHT